MSRYEEYKRSGRCVQCGKKLRKGEIYVTCAKCRARQKKCYKALQEERRREGLCLLCGAKLPEEYTMVHCFACRIKMAEKSAKQYAMKIEKKETTK